MNESFIARDVLFLEQNKLQSEMSKFVEQIHYINGYYKQPNYNQRIHRKEYQKSEVLIPNFQVLSKKFEDHTKEIEDKVIREWMEKMQFEEKYNPSNTVSMEHIMIFLKKMSSDFNNMIQFQQTPQDEQKENKRKMSTFEKDFMIKQIEDSKVTITFFTTLIQQVNQIIDCEEVLDNKNKEYIENLLDKYLEIIQASSEEIVQKGQKLLQEDQHSILTRNVRNTLLQRLLEIEQTFISQDSKNFTSNSSNIQSNKKVNMLQSSPSIHHKDDTQKISQIPIKTGQSIFNHYRKDLNQMELSISSHKETEYLDFVIRDYNNEENSQQEMMKNFKQLMQRLRKMSELVKITQTEKIHEMIEVINEFKTVLFLHNLVLKNQIEKHLKAEDNMNLYEKKVLKAKIEEYRQIVQKCYKYLEEKRKSSLTSEKPTFKRYMGDQGMITHRHFILNKDNLVPIFKHLDPARFTADQVVKRIDINSKQEEQMKKHIERIQKTNQSFSIYSQPTSHVKRKDTMRSHDMSFLSKIKSRQNSLWSKYDDNTQTSGINNINKTLQSSRVLEDGNKVLQESKLQGDKKRNISSGLGSTRNNKDNNKAFVHILKQNNAKRKGLLEYEHQKNIKTLQTNIASLINNSFDEDKVNEQILNRDQESKQILKEQNKLPHILLNFRNTLNSNQFNLTKSDINSMAENSQENLPSSMNDLSFGEMSPNSYYMKQNDEILIDIGDQQITPIKPSQRIRGVKQQNNKKNINNSFHFQSYQTRASSIEMGGQSVDYYSVKGSQATGGGRGYHKLNKNQSYEEPQDNGSTLFNSQISPLKSQEQSIDLGINKSVMSYKSSLQCSTQEIDDMVSRRQKQNIHVNRMKLPNTLPIMQSIAVQKEYQEQQIKQSRERTSSKKVRQQLPNLINNNGSNFEIQVKEYQFGEKTQSEQQQTQESKKPLKESINFYDTMYQYKLKVEKEEEENQERLNKRQKIIDSVNANFMPKYIHINGGKLASKANPQMIRNIITTFTKEDQERKQYVMKNYKKLKKRDDNDYYGIEELTCPPKEHQFITSTIFNTYDDIKTDYILSQKKTE